MMDMNNYKMPCQYVMEAKTHIQRALNEIKENSSRDEPIVDELKRALHWLELNLSTKMV